MTYFLGVDAGTTSMKAAIFDGEGHLKALDRQEYTLITPAPNVVELDAGVYWDACCTTVRSVLKQSGIAPEEIAALSISSQGETLIPLDANANPTRRAIVWLDNRAGEEADLIKQQFDADTIYRVSGQPDVTPGWPCSKILWLRRHEPEVFARSNKFLLLEDYLLYRMSGEFATSTSLETSSLYLDIASRTWWQPMMDLIGITPQRLGCLVEPGTVIGKLSPQGAQQMGLTPRTMAVSGGMDQAVGAVGAGVLSAGPVAETTGSVLSVAVAFDQPVVDPKRMLPCHTHAAAGRYLLLPWGQTAGMALKWFRDQFYPAESQASRQEGQDPYDRMTAEAAQVPAGSDGMVVLPHLEGAFSPEYNPRAKAVFFGAALRHTRAHFTRALLESIAYMLKKNLDLVEGLGIPVVEVRSLGGGARSPLWLHIKADVLQKPVVTLETEETACLGAALIAATATGTFKSLEEGVARMVRVHERIVPSSDHLQIYQKSYADYLELYDRLAPMF
jgi:sugar (pentulose or hexulose) kinase